MSDKKVLIEVKDLCKSFGNVNVLMVSPQKSPRER